jgi:hypothetical protein
VKAITADPLLNEKAAEGHLSFRDSSPLSFLEFISRGDDGI